MRRIVFALGVLVFCLSLTAHAAALSQQDTDAIDGNWVNWVPAGASGNCGAGGSIALSGSDNAQKAFNYFVGQGLPAFQAAGILGNMQAESGVLPQRLQGTPPNVITTADQAEHSSLGWGLVQWTPAGKMITPTKATGKDPNDIGVQLEFLWASLSPGGNEHAAGDALKATSNVDDAAQVFLQQFERAATKDDPAQIAMRQSFAEQMLKQYGNGAPSGTSTGSNGCSSGSSSSGYKNPFRDIPTTGDAALKPNRIDEGVDYDGAGPIYAIGNGTVNGIYYNFFVGLPFIAYTLSDGPAAGKTVYVAECVTVPAGIGTGANVTPDTIVANMNASSSSSCHSGIETGWANTASLPDPMAHDVYQRGHATAYGANFSQLLQSLGAPPGTYTYPSEKGNELGTLAPGWPTW